MSITFTDNLHHLCSHSAESFYASGSDKGRVMRTLCGLLRKVVRGQVHASAVVHLADQHWKRLPLADRPSPMCEKCLVVWDAHLTSGVRVLTRKAHESIMREVMGEPLPERHLCGVRSPLDPANPVWVSQNLRRMRVRDMDLDHLRNAAKMLRRGKLTPEALAWIRVLEDEYERRRQDMLLVSRASPTPELCSPPPPPLYWEGKSALGFVAGETGGRRGSR